MENINQKNIRWESQPKSNNSLVVLKGSFTYKDKTYSISVKYNKSSGKSASEAIENKIKQFIEKIGEKNLSNLSGSTLQASLREKKISLKDKSNEIPEKDLKSFNKTVSEAEGILKKVFPSTDKPFVESDFRANQKYSPVLDCIKLKYDEINDTNLKKLDVNDLKFLHEMIEDPEAGKPENDCEKHLREALRLLQHPSSRKSDRDILKDYKRNIRKALNTDYYKENVGKNDKFVKLLNYLCFKEYTQVDIGETSLELTVGRMDEKKPSPDKSDPVQLLQNKIGRSELNKNHKAIKNNTLWESTKKIGSSIKGHVSGFGLDPNMNGNPVNIKCRLHNGKKEVIDVRTPTPTDGSEKVNPEFKAFLRQLKDHGKKYTMVNLQNRTEPPAWKKALRLHGEYLRVQNLEKLSEDEEFKEVIEVYTLDKNSHFYHQCPKKKDLENAITDINKTKPQFPDSSMRLKKKNPEDWSKLSQEIKDHCTKNNLPLDKRLFQETKNFQKEFMDNLFNDKGPYYIPNSKIQTEKFANKVNDILNFVGEQFFNGSTHLSALERQDFIEISYLFLTDLYVQDKDADYFNQSCKDCIDRGGGANWLMMAFMTALEAHGAGEDHFQNKGTLKDRIGALPYKLEEDAIWARKRGIIDERLVRASQAIDRILARMKGEDKVSFFQAIKEQYGFKAIDYRT